MTDIEERLRLDAAAWRGDDAAPDFDAAVATATRTRSRWPRIGWLAAAAVVLLAAGLVTVVVAWPSGHRSPAAGEHPRNGFVTRAVPHVPVVAVVANGSDSRDIALAFLDNGGPLCSADPTRVASLRTSGVAVRVTVSGYNRVQYVDNLAVGHGCTPPHYVSLALRLPTPLGDRAVFDGASTRAVPVFDPSGLGTPHYLPAGFHLTRRTSGEQIYERLTSERVYQRGPRGAPLVVALAVAGTAYTAPVPARGSVSINGQAGGFTDDGGRCLRWAPEPGLAASVCAQGHLADSELVKIADALY